MSATLDREEHWQRVRELNALKDEITKLAGQLNAANYRFLKLIAEFDRRKGWAHDETHSCAHWLNWKCGIDIGAAREKVRVARALESLPLLSEAMVRGEISYSKVRAMTRVACPATEESLLMLARYGTAHHVEKMVRCYRRAKNAEELSREHRQQLERAVTYSFDDDGSLILKARLPAEAGAIVLKALDLAMQEIPAEQVQESLRDHQRTVDPETGERQLRVKSVPTARRADALRLVAETFLRQEAAQASGGDTHQIVVHVSAETLTSNAAGCCELEDGPAISAETARRLSCDASIVSRPWNFVPGGDYTGFIAGRAGLPIHEDPLCEVGCTYAVRGFDFDYVGILWLDDLIWRDGKWLVQLDHVHESGIGQLVRSARREEGPIAPAGPKGANVVERVRQAYRILLTRAIRGVFVWMPDEQTREYVKASL